MTENTTPPLLDLLLPPAPGGGDRVGSDEEQHDAEHAGHGAGAE